MCEQPLTLFPLRPEKRRFLLLRRQRVEKSRQQRAAIRVLIVHTADAVQYMPVAVQQKEIQPFAHEFKHKRFLPAAVQLVHGIQPQDKQPLAKGLFQRRDARSDQIFAQQHAEHRRLRRVFHGLLRERNAGAARPNGDQHTAASLLAGMHGQDQHVLFRHADPVDLCSQKGVFQLTAQRRQQYGVQRHCFSPK